MEALTSPSSRADEQRTGGVAVSGAGSVLLPIAGIFVASRVLLVWLLKAERIAEQAK